LARLLGIDLGRRRIGLAISDPTGKVAQGIETIVVSGIADALEKIKAVIRRYEVERIVLGRPLRMDGTRGLAAHQAEAFGERLSAETGIEVVGWDERLTSVEARRSRSGLPVRRRRLKGELDRAAATLLLQNYLDHRHRLT